MRRRRPCRPGRASTAGSLRCCCHRHLLRRRRPGRPEAQCLAARQGGGVRRTLARAACGAMLPRRGRGRGRGPRRPWLGNGMWSVEAGDWVSWAVPLSQQPPLMGGAERRSPGERQRRAAPAARKLAPSPLSPAADAANRHSITKNCVITALITLPAGVYGVGAASAGPFFFFSTRYK
jgi:hypothetical protein